MTERLYYTDAKLSRFRAAIVEATLDGLGIRLDRSAFYPNSGGQPADRGTIAGVPVTDVSDEDGDVLHILERPVNVPAGAEVDCDIDFARRLDHMQQHTGQHLLSAVLIELFGAETVSFHMGAEASTIELSVPSLDAPALEAAELRTNELIAANIPVRVSFEDASAATGLRKQPSREGTIRIVTIDGFDRSACGGTHVASTGEIGAVLIRGTERIRGNVRLEFVCGLRAVRRARADYDALVGMARTFTSSIADLPALVSAQSDRLAEADKLRRKFALELAGYRARDLHASTEPSVSGLRVQTRRCEALDEEVRAEAQSFAGAGRAAFIAWCANPASVLLAVSADSGVHAGNLLKPELQAAGGRGGGSAVSAQGGVPDGEKLSRIVSNLEGALRTGTAVRR